MCSGATAIRRRAVRISERAMWLVLAIGWTYLASIAGYVLWSHIWGACPGC